MVTALLMQSLGLGKTRIMQNLAKWKQFNHLRIKWQQIWTHIFKVELIQRLLSTDGVYYGITGYGVSRPGIQN
jgi:hypothetical protein